jgi:hypothetical protein
VLFGFITDICSTRPHLLSVIRRAPAWRARSKLPSEQPEGQPCRSSGRPASPWQWQAAHRRLRPRMHRRKTPLNAPSSFLAMSDVSLATFYVFDKEYIQPGEILQVAQRGCGGCRGCAGCAARGCAGCAARGCAGCAARGCAVRGCAVRGCAVGCRGCAVRACGGCGCVACGGCGCGTCWVWTPLGWISFC